MLDFSRVQNYYIACGYTDMRKQIDGQAALVQTQFGQEMDETSLYLFCGRRADRIKALYWDGTGYILLYGPMRCWRLAKFLSPTRLSGWTRPSKRWRSGEANIWGWAPPIAKRSRWSTCRFPM